MPMLDGGAERRRRIQLWCKDVPRMRNCRRTTIEIEGGSFAGRDAGDDGPRSCTPARIQADADLLAAIVQATEWRAQGSGLVLVGPKTLKFRPATNWADACFGRPVVAPVFHSNPARAAVRRFVGQGAWLGGHRPPQQGTPYDAQICGAG